MQADICQLGMDQRKVNMLAREYCDDIKRKLKPIIISHPMLPGLLEVLILFPGTLAISVCYSFEVYCLLIRSAIKLEVPLAGPREDVQE